MSDTVTKQRRREIMQNVKSRNTKPEIVVRKYLHAKGFRFRLNDKTLKGSPDIKLTKYKTLIFINGCFWHGHEQCRIYVMPKTNAAFWNAKITRNVERDKNINDTLKLAGWNIIVLWECDLKPKKRQAVLEKMVEKIIQNGV